MSRTQFQRLAVVTIVVLLATIASNRLMAYASNAYHAHYEADDRIEHIITVDRHEAGESCLTQAHAEERIVEIRTRTDQARAMAQAQRELAQVQRELAHVDRERAQELRQMERELRAAAREVEREVRRNVENIRIEVR